MDFGTLLSVAQKNEHKQGSKACYQTKFTPPKKEAKHTKSLSDNIKKFLARKEEEERKKALDEKKKKENLLALRDHKAQSRINKHLKVCKAANKSVLADAVDNENTAVTIAGPSQCDEDDYGYVSQEASAFYSQLMNKYSSLPPEKPLFSDDGKKPIKDIASTKDRVKQALKQQELEESLPHKRKRKHKESESDNKRLKESDDTTSDKEKEKEVEAEYEKDKPRPKKKPMPPPLDFSELLKIAEKKQYEPIKIEPKVKPKEEPERLMTKKQMKEFAKEKEWREKKEQRSRNPENSRPVQTSIENNKSSKFTTKSNHGLPKPINVKSMNDTNSEKTVSKTLPVIAKKTNDKVIEKNYSVNRSIEKGSSIKKPLEKNTMVNKSTEKSNLVNKSVEKSTNSNRNTEKNKDINRNGLKVSEKYAIEKERKQLEEEKRKLEEMRRSIEEEKRKLMISKAKRIDESRPANLSTPKPTSSKIKDSMKPSSSLSKNAPAKQTSVNNIKSRPFPPSDVKPRQFPPADVRPRQFPPPDVRSSKPKPNSKKIMPNRRRICDTDDEEYDSELDDFIDDGPDECEDYSKYISEIFGYDKHKYSHLDDDDDAAMESNFAQQLKEEFVSAKIGIMEDLEDIRQEALEKKKKALLKKKR